MNHATRTLDKIFLTFDCFNVDHTGDVAELELGEQSVEDLEGLVNLFGVLRGRGQTLQHIL